VSIVVAQSTKEKRNNVKEKGKAGGCEGGKEGDSFAGILRR